MTKEQALDLIQLLAVVEALSTKHISAVPLPDYAFDQLIESKNILEKIILEKAK